MKLRSVSVFLICILILLPASPNIGTVKPAGPPMPPKKSGGITPQMIDGLTSTVDVFQDEFGIPHVFSKKIQDLFFMECFIHARDRFFQMDNMSRTADGALSELLGRGNNFANIAQDGQLRALGLPRAAAKALPLLRPETRRIFQAYTRGINAYRSSNPLPAEYQSLKITKARPWKE